MTCSYDRTIKTWIKKEKKFTLNQVIENAHLKDIYCALYFDNYNLISCSEDCTIKIWEFTNNNYQNSLSITDNKDINGLLLLKDKNILISGGYNGTKFFKVYDNGNNIIFLYHIPKAICGCWNGLYRIDEDKIIVGGEHTAEIISMKEKKIIVSIHLKFRCNGIISIKEKNILLIGGWARNILIYDLNNFTHKGSINFAHSNNIIGFCHLKNDLLLSYSGDHSMKIWSYK